MRQKLLRFSTFMMLMVICLGSIVHVQGDSKSILTIELENVLDFALSTDHTRLLIAKTNGDLFIWDITTSEMILQLDGLPLDTKLNSISWSSDGQLVAGAFADKGRIWDAQTGELIYELDDHVLQPINLEESKFATGLDGIVFSPDGTLVATYNYFDKVVLVYDVRTLSIVHELSGHPDGGVNEIAFSSAGSLLAASQAFGGYTVWSTQTGRMLFQVPGEAMAFSHDGTMLATGAGRLASDIWIWNTENGELIAQVLAPLSVRQFEWAADDQVLFANLNSGLLAHDGFDYSGELIRGWDVGTLKETHTFGITQKQNLPIQLQPQETLIGLGESHMEGNVLIWDREDNEVIRRPLSSTSPDYEHIVAINPINTFSVSSNMGILVGGYDDGIVIWDAQTDDALTSLEVDSRIIKVAVSYPGNAIIGLTSDHQLLVWTVD